MAPRDATVGARLLWSCVGFCAAVALGLGAAHFYQRPHVLGSSPRGSWSEPDFWCSVASSGLALAVGLLASRAARGAGAAGSGSLALRALIWLGFTLLFVALWVDAVFLFTLLIAPTHALACVCGLRRSVFVEPLAKRNESGRSAAGSERRPEQCTRLRARRESRARASGAAARASLSELPGHDSAVLLGELCLGDNRRFAIPEKLGRATLHDLVVLPRQRHTY